MAKRYAATKNKLLHCGRCCTALSAVRLMSIKIKKLLLVILIAPAGLLWVGMCLFGLSIFSHAMFREFGSFALTILSFIGLGCVITAIVASFRYPKISAVSVYAASFGIAAMVIGMYIGVPYSHVLAVSAVSLLVGGVFLLIEYVRGT
ncbi:hypothetical protein [Teredinibacter turnerae]|uniref:hypothetical protein n=2 Tax=Teredinibacter turnerae TaxID=2426 RepID=UPI0005A25F35|nr:hypothetical protein [Teredinibacter turnerae]